MKDVWLAQHRTTQELRVFKFADSATRLETLRREAIVSRLLHTSLGARDDLVPVVDWNFDERPYSIESAYGGPDLIEWAARGGLATRDLDSRLAMVAALARTAAAAHAAGVLHGDIKPANILVADTGRAAPRLALVDVGGGGRNAAVRVDISAAPPGCPGAGCKQTGPRRAAIHRAGGLGRRRGDDGGRIKNRF